MHIPIDQCINFCDYLHMRTTITIADDLLKATIQISGKQHYSEAIVTSLRDYVALRKRLALLDRLFTRKLPHSWRRIKRGRKQGAWS